MEETATLSIEVPALLLRLGLDTKTIGDRVTELLAVELFADGKISSGRAASLLGLNRLDFAQLLSKYGVPYFNYTPEEFERELEVLDKLRHERSFDGTPRTISPE